MDKLTPEYDGLSTDLECKVGEPDPLIPDGEEPEPFFKEEITVPEEANVQPKGSWKMLLCILACVALLAATGILLLLKLHTPAAICACAFALAVTTFLVTLFVAEKRLLSGKGVLDKPDTRRVIAVVTESVCTSRSYKEHRDSYGRFLFRELVAAVYAVTLKECDGDGAKTYVAKSRKYYAKNDEVAAYVRGKYAYIDENDPFNAKKTI